MKKRREVNPIDVVEAAYDLDASNREWLANLAELVRPLLERGHGLFAYMFDARTSPRDWYGDAYAVNFDRDELPMLAELQARSPDITALVHLGFDGLLGITELSRRAGLDEPRLSPVIGPYFESTGITDYAALQTVEPGGLGVVFAAGQDEIRTWDRRTRRLWARINAHIGAGRRMRAALGASTGAEEAILNPNGKVEHAEGEGTAKSARTALRDAVLRQEKARGTLRKRDPEAATESWTAMVSGRWSLVDRFERGGRRYIVARRNEHTLPDPRALTPRERAIAHLAALGKPNKLIGYELGLSESTVGTHLSAAMRKLGVASRVELLRLLVQLGAPPP